MGEFWDDVDAGITLGQIGSEDGVIIRDEEYGHKARITLEKDGGTAPLSITCGVYGVMFHTRFFGTEAEGATAYEAMKSGLASIAECDSSTVPTAVLEFVEQFP